MFTHDDVIGTLPEEGFGWKDPDQQKREMLTTKDAQALMGGVNATVLSNIFGKSVENVKIALRGCQPIGHSNSGHPYYDIKEAAEYLVVGKRDLATVLKTLAPEDLPESLRTSFWDAKLKEQKYKENAKELWNTHEVMDCVAVMFNTVKTSTQLFADTMQRTCGLDDKQRDTLRALIASMLDEARANLKQNVKDSKTRCTLKDIDDV